MCSTIVQNKDNKNYQYMIYTASGFRTDIENLFAKFEETNSTKFIAFAHCFREMKFSLIFRGRHNENEMHEFIDECYLQVLSQLVNSEKPLIRRIGALYLLYSIYVKQPFDESLKTRLDFKIRITFDQLVEIRNLMAECKTLYFLDVLFIWYKLVAEAIHIVYYPYQSIGPSNTRSCQYWMSQNMTSAAKTYVNDFHNGIELHLKELQDYHDFYVESKDQFFDSNEALAKSKPNIIGHEVFKDSLLNVRKLVHDVHHNQREFRGRGRPPIWTALRTDANNSNNTNNNIINNSINNNINNSINYEKRKQNAKKKAIESQNVDLTVSLNPLYTEEVREKIKREVESIRTKKKNKFNRKQSQQKE